MVVSMSCSPLVLTRCKVRAADLPLPCGNPLQAGQDSPGYPIFQHTHPQKHDPPSTNDIGQTEMAEKENKLLWFAG